jgi:ubiquinol-cytochrome c reductase cytochrome c1 subunit
MRTDKLAPALVALALLALPLASLAEEGAAYPAAGNDIRNRTSLRRGARNFMNYCSGCHSAQYVRYSRIGSDLGIPEPELKANLMFTAERPFETIKSALAPGDGRKWFGNAPPDLSLIARARSPDYLYAYLRSFYADPGRPTGVNNTVLPGTAMPHVLADLQGLQKAVYVAHAAGEAGAGAAPEAIAKLELAVPGTLSTDKYDDFVRDTVNFLDYIAEPVQLKRRDIGVWVTLFLLVFTGFAYLLKREYFRDIH